MYRKFETSRLGSGSGRDNLLYFHIMKETPASRDRPAETPYQQPLIALVDDEESLLETLAYALTQEGYQVCQYRNGQSAWSAFQQSLPDLIILDIIMPCMDGLALCRRVRQLSETIPLLFLSSKNEEMDKVLGLELGADDYLCKPFSMRELLARVRVLLRRIALLKREEAPSLPREAPAEPGEQTTCETGPLQLDTQAYTACWQAKPLSLSITEFRIIEALARQPGHVKTREQLLTAAYPEDLYLSDRSIDNHIKRIRKKIAVLDPGASPIEAVYGLGYRYVIDNHLPPSPIT